MDGCISGLAACMDVWKENYRAELFNLNSFEVLYASFCFLFFLLLVVFAILYKTKIKHDKQAKNPKMFFFYHNDSTHAQIPQLIFSLGFRFVK
jgi:hypothetical protein